MEEETQVTERRFNWWLIIVPVLILFLVIVVGVYAFIFTNSGTEEVTEVVVDQEIPQVTEARDVFLNLSNAGRKLFLDGKYIWIIGNGLVRYDKETQERKYYTERDGLIDNATIDILRNGDEIWVASQTHGLSILNTKTDQWRYYTKENGLRSDSNLKLLLDGQYIWMSTFDGISRYDTKTRNWQNWASGAGVNFRSVQSVTNDTDYVWFFVSPNASTKGGLVRINKDTLVWEDMHPETDVVRRSSFGDIAIDADNVYLYSFSAEDVEYVYSKQTGVWRQATEEESFLLEDKRFISWRDKKLYYDQDGDLVIQEADDSKTVVSTEYLTNNCSEVDFHPVFSVHRGLILDGDSLVYGCHQGFMYFNLVDKQWDFVSTVEEYPGFVNQLFSFNDNDVLVLTDLGLGIMSLDTGDWQVLDEQSRNDIPGNVFWQDNEIYYIEEIIGGLVMSYPDERVIKKYNTDLKTSVSYILPSTEIAEALNLQNNIADLVAVKDNVFYFEMTGGILEFFPTTRLYEFYEKPADSPTQYIRDANVHGDKLWYTDDTTLFNFDLNSKTFLNLGEHNPIAPTRLKPAIYSVDENTLLFKYGNDFKNFQLFFYDILTNTFTPVSESNYQLQSFLVNNIEVNESYITQNRSGRISGEKIMGDKSVVVVDGTFIYNRSVIDVYDQTSGNWQTYISTDGLVDDDVKDIALLDNGIWILSNVGWWKLAD